LHAQANGYADPMTTRPGNRGGATLKALARELGVSHTTVSNAFRRPDQLSPALRERILTAAKQRGVMGPDPTAVGLRLGRTGQLGVLFTDRLAWAFADVAAVQVLEGIATVAEHEATALVLVPGSPIGGQGARTIADAAVDGLIMYSIAPDDPLATAAFTRRLPTVVIDQPRQDGLPFVGIDDRQAARTLTEHLLALGHRRLGILTFHFTPRSSGGVAPPDRQQDITFPLTADRLAGCRDACEAAGIAWEQIAVYECRASSESQGRTAAAALLERTPAPTALIAFSDRLALGAIDTSHAAGLDVPDQLSVVGFDDIAAGALARPALTTLRQPHRDKGQRAAEQLFSLLRGDDPPPDALLPTELVIRNSTAPPH
jgi:DNA-binding LacI/PurR family transcriptional regulator